MDDVITEENFDYFNSDKNLLILHVLLEGFYRGQNVFTLEQFLKGDYWKIGEIREEILDTNDFGSVEDLVLHQVIQIIDDLEIGKVQRVSVSDIYTLTEKIARDAVMKKDADENDVAFFTAALHALCDLEKIR